MGAVQPKNNTYLSVSCGKMVNKKKGISWGGYTGYILGISIEDDEYEGKPLKRVHVLMKDDKSEEQVIIQFNRDTNFSIGFFARIFKIDVKKPFTIGVTQSDQNEKVSFCYMKQDGLFHTNKEGKRVETVEAHATFPKPEKVDLGGGKTADNWAKPIASIDKVMVEVKARIEKEGLKVALPPAAVTAEAETVATTTSVEDDLPF